MSFSPVVVAALPSIELSPLTAISSEWPLDKSRVTIVFVHGAGFCGGFWAQQGALADTFNLVFLNLPAREGSLKTEVTVQAYAHAACAAISQLNTNVILVGHSMGGGVVQEIIEYKPSFLMAAVFVGTGARLRIGKAIQNLMAAGGTTFLEMLDPTSNHLNMPSTLTLSEHLAPTEVALNDFLACNRFDRLDKPAVTDLPILIIVGEKDILTPIKYSEYLSRQYSNSELEIVQNTGHLLPWEAADTFNQLISEFAKYYGSHTTLSYC